MKLLSSLVSFIVLVFVSAAPASQVDTTTMLRSFSSLQRMIQLYRVQKQPKAHFFAFGEKDPAAVIPPEVEAQAQRMKEITQDDCVLELPEDDIVTVGNGDMTASVTKLHMEFKGPACPIKMSVDVNVDIKNDGKEIDALFAWEYHALRDDFRKEQDISDVKETGRFYVNVADAGGSQQLDIKVDISGVGVSQQYGAFDMGHVMNTQMSFKLPFDIGVNSVMEHKFNFKSDKINLKRESHLAGFSFNESFSNNGQAVDVQTYSQLAQGIQFIAIGEEPNASNLPPLSCELKVLDKATSAPMLSLSSCLKDAQTTGFVRQDIYDMNLSFKKDWVEGVLTNAQTGKAEKITSLYDEASDVKRDLGNMIFSMTCQPVAKCK